jgi:large subunit ribosomal protein L24
MSTKLKIKKGDNVIVIAGKDKGKKGNIVKVLPKISRVIVDGINLVTQHTKATAKNAGGLVRTPASLHISNVALVDPKTNSATRVGFKVLENGAKVRVAKRSGEIVE